MATVTPFGNGRSPLGRLMPKAGHSTPTQEVKEAPVKVV
jgi:hypothetical protein